MIVLEVRCGASKGTSKRCRSLLGYVNSEGQVLYKDKTPGFLNWCTNPKHNDPELNGDGPDDPGVYGPH